MVDTGPGRSKVEDLKIASDQLRGTIGQELESADPAFSGDNAQLLKFHGVYQQDDRDVRAARTRSGLGVDHICMVRVAIPGGAMTAPQYLAMDALADRVGNGTLRITSRQGIQYHFVRKGDLRPLISALDEHLLTTLGACGDVVRNTMCCPAPLPDRARAEIQALAREVARRFRPRTRAYHDVWVDGEAVRRPPPVVALDEEPLYGAAYLPRKFKIGFALPDDNCIDIYTQDIGIVPVLDDDVPRAYTVLVGGGMGRSHTNKDTFARMADPVTTVPPGELLDVVQAIVALQRDHGDRRDRDHARLKYLVHEWGVDRVRAELSRRSGRALPPADPVVLSGVDDHLGWHAQDGDRWFLGVKVENGRIADRGTERVRSGLRAVIERFTPGVRLTAREDILLTGLSASDRAGIDGILAAHGIRPVEHWVPVERNSFSCPALPTCEKALTESERALPGVLVELGAELDQQGLGEGLDLHVRMTGCPNGCARPYTAEIGFVGRGRKSYDIHLGGEPIGIRLNHLFAENVPRDELMGVLRPVLVAYRAERRVDERFGDWCHRVGVDDLRARLGTERWVRPPRARAEAPALAGTDGGSR
jgi:sulfite reductase (ferredoxin)